MLVNSLDTLRLWELGQADQPQREYGQLVAALMQFLQLPQRDARRIVQAMGPDDRAACSERVRRDEYPILGLASVVYRVNCRLIGKTAAERLADHHFRMIKRTTPSPTSNKNPPIEPQPIRTFRDPVRDYRDKSPAHHAHHAD